ncbi:MAG: hypothetical protein HY049_11500 [Acidobacteria bacterium]|nr:hypothetical protein [Acidobacteriota bacterium]
MRTIEAPSAPRRSAPRSHALILFASVAAAAVLSPLSAFAQVSPGPLAKPHSGLEGALRCVKCHGATHESMDGRCLTCHREIAALRDAGRGLHGAKGLRACASCHPDHAGADFEMIEWEGGTPEKFDHRKAGWPLEGKHASIKCAECHQPKFRVSKSAGLAPDGPGHDHGWLGLERECASCHEDVHRGALGADCAHCHGMDRWKPVASFDHGRTTYPLSGKHSEVACAKCHEAARLTPGHDREGRTIPIYKPVPHTECSDCHADPHQGRLGAACAKCHVTEGFKRVAGGSFDHDRTRYPLRGLHRTVTCAACHDPEKAWGKSPAFARCGDCHKDAHGGQTATAAGTPDCAACHSPDGFKPSSFSVADHDRTSYGLAGAHLKVPCAACHLKSPAGVDPARLGSSKVWLRRPHEKCMDCHADAHGRQLAGSPDKGACERCHSVEAFKPSRFAASDHAKLRLPLEGRHGEIPCAACHGPSRPGLPALAPAVASGSAKIALKVPEVECAQCHFDPHGGKLKPPKESAAACAGCHDVRTFAGSRIDIETHQGFSFPLEGAHRAVPCQECHKQLGGGGPRMPATAGASLVLAAAHGRKIEFTERRTACVDCHTNPHGDQFKGRSGGGECRTCHGLDAWKPAAGFDHKRDTAFALDGAHARVACGKCHLSRSGGVTPAITYKETPTKCEACHAAGAGKERTS